MFNTTYKSDINPQVLENYLTYINQVNNHYKSFINSYTTSMATEDVMDAIGSPLSCFFNEYLARKLNKTCNCLGVCSLFVLEHQCLHRSQLLNSLPFFYPMCVSGSRSKSESSKIVSCKNVGSLLSRCDRYAMRAHALCSQEVASVNHNWHCCCI